MAKDNDAGTMTFARFYADLTAEAHDWQYSVTASVMEDNLLNGAKQFGGNIERFWTWPIPLVKANNTLNRCRKDHPFARALLRAINRDIERIEIATSVAEANTLFTKLIGMIK